jgi:hypothetical protein
LDKSDKKSTTKNNAVATIHHFFMVFSFTMRDLIYYGKLNCYLNSTSIKFFPTYQEILPLITPPEIVFEVMRNRI